MCGLVGLFHTNLSNSVVDSSALERMRDALAHRGPDDAGLYISPSKKLGLGHRRLSIINLSRDAAQPMCNVAKNLWIVFNGEIYNHAELRAELESKGRAFKTDHSDTEVILVGYEEWGVDVVHRLRGMFSFAIWDEPKQQLWVVRDRVGVKPFYYSFTGGLFSFASEIKALFENGRLRPVLDETSLYDHLSFIAVPAPRTLFKDVYKLAAGHSLLVTADGRQQLQRYWNPFTGINRLSDESETELVPRIQDALRDAVRTRMVSDVKFGVFLSGGIDSSTNTALMAELMDRPAESFTVGFEGNAAFTETQYANVIAQKYKTNHHEITLTADQLINFLPKLVYHQDEPIGDPVSVPVYYLSKLARDNGVIVCQVGEGSDELFCGYPYWKKMLTVSDRLKILRTLPAPIGSLLVDIGLQLPGLSWNARRRMDFIRRAATGEPVFWSGAEGFPETVKAHFLSDSYLKQLAGYSSFEPIQRLRDDFENDAPEGKDELHWMTYVDLRFRLPEILLMRVDKMTMAASVEGREPFLDQELIRLAMSMGRNLKLKKGTPKYLLKKAVEPWLPHEIIYRRKQGFGVPVDTWFRDRLKAWADEKILGFAKRTSYFNPDRLGDYLKNSGWQSKWFLLNVVLWHEMWIERKADRSLQPSIGASLA